VLDFSQLYPESEEAELYTRVITNPKYAKALLETLKESIKKTEGSLTEVKNEDLTPLFCYRIRAQIWVRFDRSD
jgi:hypothetical protein